MPTFQKWEKYLQIGNHHILFAIILLSLGGCMLPGNNLTRLWFYTYTEGPVNHRDSSLNPASFLELRKDGTYTRDFGAFEYGSWKEEDHKLFLTSQHHSTVLLPLDRSKPKEIQLIVNDHIKANFESQSLPDKQGGGDPFSLESNRWRIPATRKESEAEIRKRLFNHCHFWEIYFTWALDNEISTIDVRSTPTPIKIYGNGFTLKLFENLPAVWRSYFFDAEDCQKANDIIGDIFRSHTIAWAHTENKYKLFIGAFQQMETFLQ